MRCFVCCRVQEVFDAEVTLTLGRMALLTRALFPLQCLSVREATRFHIVFRHELQPTKPGTYMN